MNEEYVTLSAAWFTLSLVNAGLAQAKTRSGLNWWLLSLLLGPLATLLIVVSPPGSGAGEVAEGRMTRSQAVVIGVVVLVVAAAIFGMYAAGAGGALGS